MSVGACRLLWRFWLAHVSRSGRRVLQMCRKASLCRSGRRPPRTGTHAEVGECQQRVAGGGALGGRRREGLGWFRGRVERGWVCGRVDPGKGWSMDPALLPAPNPWPGWSFTGLLDLHQHFCRAEKPSWGCVGASSKVNPNCLLCCAGCNAA